MNRQHVKRRAPQSGWGVYLRTSSEEAQNPENSQRRQRHAIEQTLFLRSPLPVFREYVDNLSGRYASNRPGYQQMLRDARAGKFSHVAVENAERFGRNDAEALSAIDELNSLGVAVRFADYPDLDPIDPDDRILVSLSFTLARRESMKLGQRVRGGQHAKMRSGGFPGLAPDGYINREQRTDSGVKTEHGKYTRWIEQDPERAPIWRLAWDLLLEDRMTLDEICEELHRRGFHLRNGRPFVTVSRSGTRTTARNALSRIFHNWFYAGWVVSEKAQIAPKTIRGHWQPVVTTEEFEHGVAILARRVKHKVFTRRHFYLLRGIVFLERPSSHGPIKLSGSTSNSGRSGGGTAYYCVPGRIYVPCGTVDRQIPAIIRRIQVSPELIPVIKESYTEEIAHKLGHIGPSERDAIKASLQAIDVEEERALRLFTAGKITDKVWDNLWTDWQDRRHNLQASLDGLSHTKDHHISNLDDALALTAKVSILYEKLDRVDQRELLNLLVERVVVNPEGKIIRLELHPPFSYLHRVIQRVTRVRGRAVKTKTNASVAAGECSELVSSDDPDRFQRLLTSPRECQVRHRVSSAAYSRYAIAR